MPSNGRLYLLDENEIPCMLEKQMNSSCWPNATCTPADSWVLSLQCEIQCVDCSQITTAKLRMSNLWAPGQVPVAAISTRMALRRLLLGLPVCAIVEKGVAIALCVGGRGWRNETCAPTCISARNS